MERDQNNCGGVSKDQNSKCHRFVIAVAPAAIATTTLTHGGVFSPAEELSTVVVVFLDRGRRLSRKERKLTWWKSIPINH
ncbi:hypothetical protein L6452_02013 [Arctium lappa]|uniref:Uncharacterized protein n=1 Tax=Arctium lappa TaxID=4217 RepID=A0ACB9FI95_ARCLA|nr:hypothetical protein L6452_02013 [Arctium lappa]